MRRTRLTREQPWQRIRQASRGCTPLTNLAATGASAIAVMATAEHRSMQTTKGYLHLAGVVFHDEAANLERGLLGVQDRVSPKTALQGQEA